MRARTRLRPLERFVGAFGEKLRKQREQRGLALEAISNTTKISTRMLRALEEEHFDQLPGGVFNKGFVRAYARQIGLDEEETVVDYLVALRESQIQAQQILPDFRTLAAKHGAAPATEPRRPNPVRDTHSADNLPSNNDFAANHDTHDGGQELRARDRRKGDRRKRDPQPQGSSTPGSSPSSFITLPEESSSPELESAAQPPASRFPRMQMAAVLLLIIVGLAAWISLRRREAVKPADSANQSLAAVSARPSSVTHTTPVASPKSAKDLYPAATAKTSSEPNSREDQAVSASTNDNSVTKTTLHPPASLPAATTLHPAAAKAPATFTVLIRAEENSWVLITADGKPVAQETLIAPAHTSVRAVREIIVRAGNAAGISFLLNGKEIPAGGSEGEVKTYTFDATGVRVLPQAALPATNR